MPVQLESKSFGNFKSSNLHISVINMSKTYFINNDDLIIRTINIYLCKKNI